MESKGVVTANVANLYHEPSKAVELVTQATLGMELLIQEGQDGWFRVQTPDQYSGWIQASKFKNYAPGEAPYASTDQVVEIDSLLAFLYYLPRASTRAPALQVTIGTRLEVVDEGDGWLEVVLPSGSRLWVQRGDLVDPKSASHKSRGSIDAIIATAKRFLGLPYLWGGTTPLGIDCSAFVQLVYHLHGVQLLRDSHIQFTQPDLEVVNRQDLQTGDLVFFGREQITHVGLCIGGGRFIHATVHRRPVVQISPLEEQHWVDLYQGARRPQLARL
jgi:cell wall-associated NlpC family hydrolase